MDLRTQLSFSSGMTKFLAGKQITLLNPSMTLNLACTSLMIRKYQRNSKNSTKKKLEKMSLTWNSNMKLKKRLTLSRLNQTSSSEIFFNIKHIKQAIKISNKSSAPGPDQITVELVENRGEQLLHCPTHLMQVIFLGTSKNPGK